MRRTGVPFRFCDCVVSTLTWELLQLVLSCFFFESVSKVSTSESREKSERVQSGPDADSVTLNDFRNPSCVAVLLAQKHRAQARARVCRNFLLRSHAYLFLRFKTFECVSFFALKRSPSTQTPSSARVARVSQVLQSELPDSIRRLRLLFQSSEHGVRFCAKNRDGRLATSRVDKPICHACECCTHQPGSSLTHRKYGRFCETAGW